MHRFKYWGGYLPPNPPTNYAPAHNAVTLIQLCLFLVSFSWTFSLFSLVTCVLLFEFPATHQFPWTRIIITAVRHLCYHHVYLSSSPSLSVCPVSFALVFEYVFPVGV